MHSLNHPKAITWKQYSIALVIIFVLGIESWLYAGVIVLKTGEEIAGTITKKTKEYIEIKIKGEIKIYKLADIKSIKGRKPALIQDNSFNDTELSFEKGLLTAGEGFFLDAEKIFKKIRESDPSNLNVKEALAIIDDFRQGNVGGEFARYLFKGAYYLLTKEYKKAIEEYKKVLEIKPGSYEVYYNLGSAYQAIDLSGEAIIYFEKLFQINPNDYSVLLKLGFSYHLLNKYHQSIVYLEKGIKLFPDDPKPYSILGVNYYSIGEPEKAKQYLKRAKDLYLETGNQERAEEIERLIKSFI
ncbi:MAG: tetratricopeptide repeat protein [Omnitrophica bacterium]|nr:tetratricopeptide repeat protein [Candidatus Omnitrophota bacterium]